MSTFWMKAGALTTAIMLSNFAYGKTASCSGAGGNWMFYIGSDGSSAKGTFSGPNLDGKWVNLSGKGNWTNGSNNSWFKIKHLGSMTCTRTSGGDMGKSSHGCRIESSYPKYNGYQFQLNCNIW